MKVVDVDDLLAVDGNHLQFLDDVIDIKCDDDDELHKTDANDEMLIDVIDEIDEIHIQVHNTLDELDDDEDDI